MSICVTIVVNGCVRKYLPLGKRQRVDMGSVVTLRKGVANLPAIGIEKKIERPCNGYS